MTVRHLLLASATLAIAACTTTPAPKPVAAAAAAPVVQPAEAAAPAPRFAPWGVDLTAADPAVKPGDDFWSFVNGGWASRTQIAADRSYVGIDSVLNDQIEKDVRSIIEAKAADPQGSGKLCQQIGDF
jgi:endothelin-converting enzyme/putative endopeptidase